MNCLVDAINAFKAFKTSKGTSCRRTPDERASTLQEFDTEGEKIIARLSHTTFYRSTCTYTVSVMVDRSVISISCTRLSDAITASSLARAVQQTKKKRDEEFVLSTHAPYSLFGEDGWQRFRDTTLYFHRDHDFYRNASIGKRERPIYGRKIVYLGGEASVKTYCSFVDALYETFHGIVPEGRYVRQIDEGKSITLSNIECADTVCAYCSARIDIRYGRKYCDSRCKQRANPGNLKCHTDLRAYLASKCNQYACTPEDALAVAERRTCAACGLTDLHLRNDDNDDPRKLVIDCVNRMPGESRREAHRRGNIQCLCFMCNAMKNDAPNETFMNLIAFLQGERDLDLSGAPFQCIGTQVSKGPQHSFQNTWRAHDPNVRDPWLRVSEHFEAQAGVDAIYNRFPLLFLTGRSIFCCSVDRIVAGDNTKGFQLVPVFMNYAKASLSNDEVRYEFRARGWLQPEHAATVILPKDYLERSYVIANMGKRGRERSELALRSKGCKRSAEFCAAISNAKRGKANIHGRRRMVLVAIPKPPYHGPPNRFDYFQDAVRDLGLHATAITNISSCVKGKLATAYGYIWQDWSSDVRCE